MTIARPCINNTAPINSARARTQAHQRDPERVDTSTDATAPRQPVRNTPQRLSTTSPWLSARAQPSGCADGPLRQLASAHVPLLPRPLPNPDDDEERQVAYVTEKRGVFYAVIYEGRNPVTGRERRLWHRCDDQATAVRLSITLGERRRRQHRSGSSTTLGDYLLGQWLPAKEATLAPSTHARYVTSVEHYLLPHLGDTTLRRLRPDHLESLPAAPHLRQPARRATRSQDRQEPPPDHPRRPPQRRRTWPVADQPGRNRARSRPTQAAITPTESQIMDRRRARQVPYRHRRLPLLDAVPTRRRHRHAPR